MTETAFTDPFWEALADGRFVVPHCEECGEYFFPPAPSCPHCYSTAVDWAGSPGRGTLYSVTRQHATADGFPDELVVGLVALEEEPRVLAEVDAPYDELAIGDAVVIEPRAYPHEYDRGRRADDPFFVARLRDDSTD
ncbi:hypothetical protein C483_08684 [Natrialba hulunbeirensis JCM 10989]|uniref:DUF35 domain-containing protein n=1 Tax=Natrialba hulunbeirensis JCM 10989 TaxID=1227493 RepID=M0A016_9EURY|nr:zinc ribbon domain-containing protein [Natrialba hulunbeirensis]ELY92090.1 hypothetical protein C483_08684 [Natrialba hulunbeirensis JCM 10989]